MIHVTAYSISKYLARSMESLFDLSRYRPALVRTLLLNIVLIARNLASRQGDIAVSANLQLGPRRVANTNAVYRYLIRWSVTRLIS